MDESFKKNEDKMKLLVSEMNQKILSVMPSKKAVDKLHEKGKLSARERIDLLLDKDSQTLEIGAFVGDGMYVEHGGCPAGGVVVVVGKVSGKQCVVVANDATVKAGAWFPITGKKNLRAQVVELCEQHFRQFPDDRFALIYYAMAKIELSQYSHAQIDPLRGNIPLR